MKPTALLDFTPGGSLTGIVDAAGNLIQAVVVCEASGHLAGSLDSYVIWYPWTVGVAAARTTHLDLFNASGSGRIVRVRSLQAVVDLATVVVGVGFRWEVLRTNTVGTSGAARTPVLCDTAFAALPAQITARSKPTGGAATDATLVGFCLQGDEAAAANQLQTGINLLAHVGMVTLREGFGLKVDQVTSSIVGNFGWLVGFTTETP